MQSSHLRVCPNPSLLRLCLPFPGGGPSPAPLWGVFCGFHGGKRRQEGDNVGLKVTGKDNVWSVDNKLAKAKEREEKGKWRRRRRGKRVRNGGGKRGRNARVLVSGAMLVEVETVLQTQEPVIKPAWSTFASSLSGIWKGVGAVFSPFTAEMEPIGIGNKNENLYDCYTLLRIEEASPSSRGHTSQIRRKINWVPFNPFGEFRQLARMRDANKNEDQDEIGSSDDGSSYSSMAQRLPSYEASDLGIREILEDDVMDMEPGLVFFEDGSYSRGPIEITVGDNDDSKYYLSPTFKFEQCLVKGCHKRLRIIHTIEFSEGGSDIQIIRVAVYEEQWSSPSHVDVQSDTEFDLRPFSLRKRVQPLELTGSWKVFEVSATPVFGEETTLDEGKLPYVYLCTETLKKRSFPESTLYFGEEEMLDMQDVTMLWLPGGITGYVDVKKDGVLCVGVGWYTDDGVNLVMERDYGTDGKLKEVRSKSEVKRRWSDPVSL